MIHTTVALSMVSELTTNALIHAGSATTIVALLDDGRLRVEVHDEDRVRHGYTSDPTAAAGGLRVVATLIDGVAPCSGGGPP